MLPYIILLIFTILVVMYQERNGTLKIKVMGLCVDVIPIFVYLMYVTFFSLREYIGYDYPRYVNVVINDDIIGYEGRNEYISALFLHLAYLNGDYHLFFFLVAIVSFAGFIYSLYKYIEDKASLGWGMLAFLALPMGFTEMLSPQRQFLALGIFLLSFKYLLNGRFKKYILVVVVSMLSHVASVIGLLLYSVRHSFVTKKSIAIITVLMFVCCFFAIKILSQMIPFFGHYIEVMKFAEGGGELQLILYLLIGAFSIYIGFYNKSRDYHLLLKTFLVGVSISVILAPFDLKLGFRMAQYGIYSFMFMIPMYFPVFGKYRNIVKIFAVIILSFLYLYNLSVTYDDFYLPYKTWL